jgi:hypothetical protein
MTKVRDDIGPPTFLKKGIGMHSLRSCKQRQLHARVYIHFRTLYKDD